MEDVVPFNTIFETARDWRSLLSGHSNLHGHSQGGSRISFSLLTPVFAAVAGALALKVSFIVPTAHLVLSLFLRGQPGTCLETETVIDEELVRGVLTDNFTFARSCSPVLAAVAAPSAIKFSIAIPSTVYSWNIGHEANHAQLLRLPLMTNLTVESSTQLLSLVVTGAG